MNLLIDWWTVLVARDAPALPNPTLLRYSLLLSWLPAIGLFGAVLGWKFSWQMRRALALLFMLGALATAFGPLQSMHWLGLAFQSLSFPAMLLCALALYPVLAGPDLPIRQRVPVENRVSIGYLLLAVLPGYVLLLDTFALLPLQMYAWGFGRMALFCLLLLGLLPLVLALATPKWWVLVPASLLLFAATRLPTGNVWDALLDPWLWLFANGVLVRDVYRRFVAVNTTLTTKITMEK
ncbi:MAG: hypothetical protein ORN28_10025 [Rhodoferax sp.]|nr:hypothetical protein [Rhodoferax sp.]